MKFRKNLGSADLWGFTLLLIGQLIFLTTGAFSQSAAGWKAKWVAPGRYTVGLGANSSIVEQLQKRGLAVGVMPYFKDVGTHVGAGSGMIMLRNKAPHPNAAAIFINWLLSRDGQTSWTKAVNDLSRRIDVPADNVPSYRFIRAGVSYWRGYLEKNVPRSEEEEKLLKKLFSK